MTSSPDFDSSHSEFRRPRLLQSVPGPRPWIRYVVIAVFVKKYKKILEQMEEQLRRHKRFVLFLWGLPILPSIPYAA